MALAENRSSGYLQRAPSPSGLADVLDVILDKGLVIDAYVRVSVIGIELLTIDARIVIASVDTYLRFAEAVNRLDLAETGGAGLTELQGVATREMAKGAVEGVAEEVKPESPAARKALKSVAAGAAAAGAAAAAKVVADRVRNRSNGSQGESDSDS
jgi:gas vesicle structural protein